jgi:hypothetical protein
MPQYAGWRHGEVRSPRDARAPVSVQVDVRIEFLLKKAKVVTAVLQRSSRK